MLVPVHACNFQGVVSYLGVRCIVCVACTVYSKSCIRSNIDLNATGNLRIVFNTGDKWNNRNRECLGVSTEATNNELIVSYCFDFCSIGVGFTIQLQCHFATNYVRSECLLIAAFEVLNNRFEREGDFLNISVCSVDSQLIVTNYADRIVQGDYITV